jgi:hypothetical protein
MTYFYTKWGSFYGRNNNTGVSGYDMSAVLDHIDYGTSTAAAIRDHGWSSRLRRRV